MHESIDDCNQQYVLKITKYLYVFILLKRHFWLLFENIDQFSILIIKIFFHLIFLLKTELILLYFMI